MPETQPETQVSISGTTGVTLFTGPGEGYDPPLSILPIPERVMMQ